MNTSSNIDRRRFPRVAKECDVQLQRLPPSPQPALMGLQQGLACDISEGGMSVWTDRLWVVNSTVLVELKDDHAPEGVQAIGTVVWVEPNTAENRWLMGIQFADIGDTARDRIRSLMDPAELVH